MVRIFGFHSKDPGFVPGVGVWFLYTIAMCDERLSHTQNQRPHAGTRTRVFRVKAKYPNLLALHRHIATILFQIEDGSFSRQDGKDIAHSRVRNQSSYDNPWSIISYQTKLHSVVVVDMVNTRSFLTQCPASKISKAITT